VDEIRAIRERRVTTDIAQAIGRLRLRTMTSQDGACTPCVLLTLPGAVVAPWERGPAPSASPCRPQPGRTWARRYAGQMKLGTAERIPEVRQRLGAALGTWNRFAPRGAINRSVCPCAGGPTAGS
jgi:hypothetical protein